MRTRESDETAKGTNTVAILVDMRDNTKPGLEYNVTDTHIHGETSC